MTVLSAVFKVIGPFVTIPIDEAGERQVFFATSARFPPREARGAAGVATLPQPPTSGGRDGAAAVVEGVARGTDGQPGSGVYSISIEGESAKPKAEQLLARMRADGTRDKVWAHTEGEFVRITGVVSV